MSNLKSPGAPTPRADERGLDSPLYTDNAKPPKELSILRSEHKLEQQGICRRVQDLRADCLKRRSGNQLCDGECGNWKSRRAATRPKHCQC
eukprot:3183187-Pleurochrysis_carterae.AAC.3